MNIKTLFAALFFLAPFYAFGWGEEGHKMVATIAQKKLKPGVEKKVKQYLDSTTFEQAAVWMDDVRSDHSYDYMKTWHYVNVEKGGTYAPAATGDAVSRLDTVIKHLEKYKTMKPADVKRDLQILFHLCGDIAQPLHAGYGSDKGGNDIKLLLLDKKTNLHHVWDTDIIVSGKITVDSCLLTTSGWTRTQLKTYQKIDPLAWMNDSRSFLDRVYDFKDGKITQAYVDANKKIVEQQLMKAGLRLAAVLNKIFAK